MNIELQLSVDTICAINNVMKQIYELPVSQDKRENVYKSIGFDLADKIDKRYKNLIKKADLFDKKKKKLSLKYHEAWAMEAIIIDLLDTVENDYHRSLLSNLTNIINQKIV